MKPDKWLLNEFWCLINVIKINHWIKYFDKKGDYVENKNLWSKIKDGKSYCN